MVMSIETERKVNSMCNLSEVMLEKGIEQGIEIKLIQLVYKKMQKGKTAQEIAEEVKERIEKVEKIYKIALQHNADMDKAEDILNSLRSNMIKE